MLAQLLHALNQPLTGLQCSMEVALASPRTAEQYAGTLREGLELTERMRTLVEAIREVTDMDGETIERREAIEWKTFLREVVDDLLPVAEVRNIRLTLDCSAASSLGLTAVRSRMAVAAFRLLESALSLALERSAVRTVADASPAEVWMRVQWAGTEPCGTFSRPELGLLVAQAGWQQVGAHWERERKDTLETVTIRLPGFSGNRKF